jgi:2-C-methyl-D-erythritol 4-phosphate cytidylyltransferase
VRPFTAAAAIEDSFRKAELHGGAIVAAPCQDSLRRLNQQGSEGVSRDGMYLVQTPQTFKSELIKWAYEMADLSQGFTDDATVFEDTGHKVAIVEGSATNIKITTQADMEYARFLFQKNTRA